MILTIVSKYVLVLSLLFVAKYFFKIVMKILTNDLTPLDIRWYDELLLFLTITYIITFVITK
jgi:hypothetical protein